MLKIFNRLNFKRAFLDLWVVFALSSVLLCIFLFVFLFLDVDFEKVMIFMHTLAVFLLGGVGFVYGTFAGIFCSAVISNKDPTLSFWGKFAGICGVTLFMFCFSYGVVSFLFFFFQHHEGFASWEHVSSFLYTGFALGLPIGGMLHFLKKKYRSSRKG